MEIVIENSFIDSLKTELDQILKNCFDYNNEKHNIFIVEKKDFDTLQTKIYSEKNYDELKDGYGLTFHNYNFVEMNKKCHLIILNQEICEFCQLDFNEKIAITLHELGHILNDYPKRAFSLEMLNSIVSETNLDELINKQEEKLEKEYFADFYAKKNGYSEQIKSSLIKYSKFKNTHIHEFELRIKQLQDDKILNGKIKKLNS